MTEAAAAALALLAARDPAALPLARLAALAARIEPELLRALRLALVPAATAGTEAELWFSEAVHARGARSITLDPEVVVGLRADVLAEPRDRIACAVRIVRRVHHSAPALLRLEERLVVWSVLGRAARVDAALAEVVSAMVAEPDRAEDLAAWAHRALPRLPGTARDAGAYWAVLFAANARLRSSSFEPPPSAAAVAAAVPAIFDGVEDAHVAVERRGDTVRLRLVDAAGSGTIPAPAVRPIVVVVTSGDATPHARIALRDRWSDDVPVTGATIRLRVADGREHVATTTTAPAAAGTVVAHPADPERAILLRALVERTRQLRIAPACARIRIDGIWQTGYLIGARLVATVPLPFRDPRAISVHLGDVAYDVERVESSVERGVMVLRLATPVPGITPLALAEDGDAIDASAEWSLTGYLEPSPGRLVHVSGVGLHERDDCRHIYPDLGDWIERHGVRAHSAGHVLLCGAPVVVRDRVVAHVCDYETAELRDLHLASAARVRDVIRRLDRPLVAERARVIPNRIHPLAWSPDGTRLAAARDDRSAQVWDMSGHPVTPLLAHRAPLNAVAWSPDGARLATASDDGTARIWDGRSGEPVTPWLAHHDRVTGVAWSPGATWVATVSDDRTARIWHAFSGEPATPPLAHDARAYALAWSPDGRRLATGGMDHMMRIWDVGQGNLAIPPVEHEGDVWNVAWSPDGLRVAAAGGFPHVGIWDASTGRLRTPPLVHGGPVNAVAWSPDGLLLATASDDGTAQIWSAATGAAISPALGHGTPVRGVAWSPDGWRVATASEDQAARVWEARDGRLLTSFAHPSGVHAVTWSPDGRTIATASAEQMLRVWDAVSGKLIMSLFLQRDAGSPAVEQPAPDRASAAAPATSDQPGPTRPPQAATAAGPTHVEFIIIAPDRSELASQREVVTAYGEDVAEWRPFHPAVDTSIGVLLQQVAIEQRLTAGFRPFPGDLARYLETAADSLLVVFVIDVWVVRIARYLEILSTLDEVGRNTKVGVVVIWNSADRETVQSRSMLQATLRSTLSNLVVMRDAQVFHDEVETPEQLVTALGSTLAVLGRRVVERPTLQRPERQVRARLPDAHALVIGISHYQHLPSLPELRDASDVAAVLSSPLLGGYPPDHVQLLLDAAATRVAIVDALEALAKQTSESSTVLFYFSGHGGRIHDRDEERLFLLPVDAPATGETIARAAISGVELSSLLHALPAATVTVVLECDWTFGLGAPRDIESVLAPELPDRGLTPLAQGRGRAVLAASRRDVRADRAPGQRNSAFTGYLLDGLHGAADGPGGVIRVHDLFDYVRGRMAADEAEQPPILIAELVENYPIALYRGGVAPPGTLTPALDDYAYDVFLSYASYDQADRAFALDVVVPQLESYGLRVCTLERDARIAAGVIAEVERLLTTSRYAVGVFTPAYVESVREQHEFELAHFLSMEGRLARCIPLLRRPCSLPLGIRMLAIVDVTEDATIVPTLQRLARQLREPPVPQS